MSIDGSKLLDDDFFKVNSGPVRRWPLNLFECYTYRDMKGNTRWCPEFCPGALLSSSSLVGRIVTDLDDAEPVCCRMSCKGLCCCIMLCPISFYSPTGGLGLMCLITNYLRSRTIEKYGVEETDMNMAIEYWEREDSLTGEKETFIEQNVRSA